MADDKNRMQVETIDKNLTIIRLQEIKNIPMIKVAW